MRTNLPCVRGFQLIACVVFGSALWPVASQAFTEEDQRRLCTGDVMRLCSAEIPDVERTYTARDAIFYALRLGLGQNPVNADELPFVYEKNTKVLPTFPVVVAQPRPVGTRTQ